MAETAKRTEGLSLFAAIAFAVGNMVGAGVFVLSGLIINVAGPAALLSYLICGGLVAFSGLSYATLASIFPEDGGGYLFARRMLGSYPGFLAGWAMYISLTIASAFVLLGFGIYLNLLVGGSFDPRLGALGGLVLLTALNIRGLSEAGKLEIGLVVTKVVILAALIIAGLLHIQSTDFIPLFPNGTGGMLQGVAMVYFAYLGFQVVTMMGGEVKESSRSVPLAMLVSIGIVAVIYSGVIIALLAANLPVYGGNSVFDAAVALLGTVGGIVVAFGAVASTLSAANANVIGGSRIILEMSSEEQIPGRFARLRNDQPINSILLGAAIVLILIVYGQLDFIVDLTNATVLFTMILVNVSAFILLREKKRLSAERTYFRPPLGVLFPVLGIASSAVLLATLPPVSLAFGAGALLLGTVFYAIEDTLEGKATVREIRVLLGRKRS
jgi:APA family basic amino acid/polyamine antiporter